jgi:HEAT repeat protein
MNKERSRIGLAASAVTRAGNPALSRTSRLGLTAALGASLVLCGPDGPRAQQRNREPEVTVTGINASGNTVSISASGSLNRAQTWQDQQGFHVVLVNGLTALGGSARGVKVQRVGNSLELIVPVKPGASVTVHPRGDRLDLVMSGGGPEALAPEATSRSQARASARQAAQEAAPPQPVRAPAARRQEFDAAASEETPQPRPQRAKPSETTTDAGALAGAAPKPAPAPAEQPAPAGAGGDAPPAPEAGAAEEPAQAQPPTVEIPVTPARLQSGASLGSFIFSLPALLALLGLAVVGALAAFVLRRRRAGGGDKVESPPVGAKKEKSKESAANAADPAAGDAPFEQFKGDRRKSSLAVPFERRRAGVGAEDQASRELKTLEGKSAEGANPALPAVQFGAYRIDQEVAQLVQGRPHSAEVLASRAADDRRAIATSLQKALRAPETDEDGRRRARMALEDYGFVARECAALLLGTESFERASAARTLGEMRSAQALPFLTEALYDADAVVRMSAVQSLGDLGLPSALGALLHTAHNHPEIPASVISPALTACSVETLELAWETPSESRAFAGEEGVEEFAGDVRVIVPVSGYEELPDSLADETLGLALAGSRSEDAGARAHAAQALAQFQVRRAVEALSAMATLDAEASVRAAAVTSLGLINHESVFVPVIVAMADGAREVRAAAARALSRLSFDRADAYVRVYETADARTLSEVARACVSAGLAGQAINRLASEERRQGYEAFSLLSLVVKAGEVQPLLDAIECHRDVNVRLACVGMLGQAREAGLSERLLQLAESADVPDRVRAALRETASHNGQLV